MGMSTQEILSKFRPEAHNLLNILHALQNNHPQNYLSNEALTQTARYLNITRSSVYGVATYYSMFSLQPRGRYIIRVCVSAVCEMLKTGGCIDQLQQLLGIGIGETTPDGLITLELSECLGQCHEAPSMMVNEKVFNHLDEGRIRDIIEGLRD